MRPSRSRQIAVPLMALVLLTLLLAIPAGAQDAPADGAVPADAPAPDAGKITRVMTFGVIDGDAPVFDMTKLGANPGDAVVLRGDFRPSSIPHNIDAKEGLAAPVKSSVAPNALHVISFKMPAEGKVHVVCDLHSTMTLSVVPIAELAAAGGETAIPGLGVHFLAYWVGVIAFMLLFVVYGATFFLFKYNETNATTDHWDRTEGAGKPGLAKSANLLALVIAVVAVAAIVWFATR